MSTAVITSAPVFSRCALASAMFTADVTTEQLAERIHRSTGTVNAYLDGHTVLSVNVASRIAAALGTTLDALLTEPRP
ncbi:hypothetical protein Ppa06_57940 [Planomonospora parontospora subsp. parontospora]|uniref:HTH cro/C1-type domain-containing protein n=2 Tax=Planomonospora parontospora TaxID=58119 RepID=A0AA37F781_9ACTN|nr:helix-turn-helix transcriptional regulator [Planomonospora parontospora]GGK90440.1 hypothetical protein GCM10010126_57370 [Planomonospora parontospora]GII11996.1 hypothetical protein Ppa06_57940 [Planomonospora parontospora subsp. parontospora]